MTSTVEFSRRAKTAFEKPPVAVQGRLHPKIKALATNPRPPEAEALAGEHGSYRIRDGNDRALYTIHDDIVLVDVCRVASRKDTYERL